MKSIQCRVTRRKITQTVGKDDELVLGYIIAMKEYKMFNEKGELVKIWYTDEIDVSDCWNFSRFDKDAKWQEIKDKNRERVV